MHYFPDLEGWESGFQPRTPTQFFALQLARRLNDIDNLKRYVQLVETYREDQILRATRGIERGPGNGDMPIERLEAELSKNANRMAYE